MKWSLRLAALGLATTSFVTVGAFAQTQFSVQGQVRSVGVPVNGNVDVVLELLGVGVPAGTVSTHLATPAVNGLFTLNNVAYADGLWTGLVRAIRIWVRFPAGGGAWPAGYTALAPTVPVAPTPYAIKAASVVDNSIVSASIANGAVTTDDILNLTIATADIANGAVTDAKINDVAWGKLTGVPLGFADGVDNTSAFALPFSDPAYAGAAVAFSVVATNASDIFNARIDNAASAAEVFQGTSNGVGNTMETRNTGTGRAFYANIANGGNASDAALITTNGTGSAAVLTTTNAANASPTLEISQVGTGAGILVTAGSGRGIDIVGTTGTGLNISTTSGDAILANVTGNNNAVQGTVGGMAAGIYGRNNSATTGWGGYFWMANAANTGIGLQAINSGDGRIAVFNAGKATNAAIGVEIDHSGTGTALDVFASGGKAANFATGAGNNNVVVQISAANNGPALDINASGTAEAFRVTNTGTDNTMEISSLNAGNSAATIWANSNGTGFTIDAYNTNAGGKAARFRNTSGTNNQRTVEISNAGSGNALFATNTGTGAAAYFSNPAANGSAVVIIDSTTNGPALDINATGAAEAFRVTNTGTDNSMEINTNNAANGVATILSGHSGTGISIDAYNTNAGGKAARFRNTSGTNNQRTVEISNAGSGNALFATNTGTGAAAYFSNPAANGSAVVIIDSTTNGPALDINATGAAEAFRVTNTGTDNGMEISNTNAANSVNTIYASQSGTGRAAQFNGAGTSLTTGTAIEVNNTSTGRAARFINNSGAGLTATMRVTNNSGTAGNDAAIFDGDVSVLGALSKTSGTFMIDHPLDPANKYLYHSFVESPDMMNIYNGNVTTNESGEAWVQMPAYFEALNMEFRYQLTCIGQFSQAIVATEIEGNRFQVRTDKPNVKVSWQVTGVRKDPYAMANRVRPEVDKPSYERGYYVFPAGYGAPDAMSMRNAPESEADAVERANRTTPKK